MALFCMPKLRKATPWLVVIRTLLVLLIVANMAFIWYNSAKVSTVSNKSSRKIATGVAKVVVEDYENLSRPVQKKHISKINVKLRSLGHFAEFVPLGFLVFLFLLSLGDLRGRTVALTLFKCLITTVVLCAFYALSDEIHQIFVRGRTFQITDILVDSLGTLSGCVMALVPVFIFKKRIF